MRIRRKHSLPTRLFHWLNAPVLAIMIVSGLFIYWANGVYRVDVFGVTLVQFFPDWFYRSSPIRIDHRLAEGMAWHFTFMWVFALNGLLYVGYTLWSGEWRALVPTPASIAGAWQVVLHDLGIRKEPLPPGKFNHAQRIAYTGVVVMGAGSLLTGLAIYKPVQLGWLASLLGGYPAARARALRADDRVCALLRRPHCPGRPRGVEQFPSDGHRRRGRAGREGGSRWARPHRVGMARKVEVRDLRRVTRRGFAVAGAAVAAGVGGLAWMTSRSLVDGLPWPFRSALRANERIWSSLFGRQHLAREFPASSAREPRANGDIGLDGAVRRGFVAAPCHRPRGRAVADLGRPPAPAARREHERAEMRRGLERGRRAGRASASPTSPP